MTSDSGSLRLMRYRLVESVVPLAAPPAKLVAYAHRDGADINDTVGDFIDWTYDSVPTLVADGLSPGNIPSQLETFFHQTIAALDSAPGEACETAALYPEWADVRATATQLLNAFRDLGIPIPSVESKLLGDVSTVPPSQR